MKLKKILEDVNVDSGSSPHTAYEIDEYGYEEVIEKIYNRLWAAINELR